MSLDNYYNMPTEHTQSTAVNREIDARIETDTVDQDQRSTTIYAVAIVVGFATAVGALAYFGVL